MKQHEIALDACSAGMKLAESVVDDNDVVFLAEGTLLTEKLIANLSERGISTVCVETIEQLSEEEKQRRRQQIEDQIKQRFRKVIENPLMQELCDALIDYRSASV